MLAAGFPRDLFFGGSFGLSVSGEKLRAPGSVELELLALAVLDLVSQLVLESRSLLRAKDDELVLAVLPVLVLDVLLGTPPLPLDLSLELKNLNLSNIEFLLGGTVFCEVLLFEAVELVEVVLPVLTTRGCFSPDGLGVVNDRPPGVGIPDPGTAGEVARDDGWLVFAGFNDEPVGNVADCVLLFCWLRCLSVDDLDFPPDEDTGLVDGLVIVGHLLFPDLNGDGSLDCISPPLSWFLLLP